MLAAWTSAITSASPGLSGPGTFVSGQPTIIADDVQHALELIGMEMPAPLNGSVFDAIGGIAAALSIPNNNPVIGIAGQGGSDLPLHEAGIDSFGDPFPGSTTHSYTLALSDPDGGDTPVFSVAGWTLVSDTLYSKTGLYGTATFNTAIGQVTYTLNNNDADTQALAQGQAVTETFSVTVFDTNGGMATRNLQFGIVGTNDAPINAVPAATQAAIFNTDFQFDLTNGNLIAVSDDSATLTVILTATNGVLTLSGATGLTFDFGTGTGDITMSFSGGRSDINAALAGLIFTPDSNYFGAATVTTWHPEAQCGWQLQLHLKRQRTDCGRDNCG